MHEGDLQLVARMLAGEQRAFDAFFASYAGRLHAFVARRAGLDAASVEDVVQNSLIKAMRGLSSYRGDAALFTWLSEIARNELADVRRRAARRPAHHSLDAPPFLLDEGLQLQSPTEFEPPGQIERTARSVAVLRALNDLPQRFALALEWKYGDELPVEEIGRMLGITTIAAQSLLARAREAFRKRWQENPDEAVTDSGAYAGAQRQ